MATESKDSQVFADTGLRDGFAKNHQLREKLAVMGKEVKVSDAIETLDARIAAAKDVEVKRRAYLQATAAYHELVQVTNELVSSLRAHVIVRLGKTAPALADYGIAPRKVPSKQTTEERAFSIAKGKATREARHTLGKKALAKLRGERPTQIVLGDAPPTPPTPLAVPPSTALLVASGPDGLAGSAQQAATQGQARIA